MEKPDLRPGSSKEDLGPEEFVGHLKALQRREWWTWGMSIGVMLLLTGAVASLSLPTILSNRDGGGVPPGSGVVQSIVGLVCLILLFGAYLTYEKVLINRLRMELAQGQVRSIQWRNLALVDPLTGLYNRRFAERRLSAEIGRAERRGYALTLVLFDLDSFKGINDKFGHAAGDVALKEFGERLSKAVREADVAARLGGDEFMLLLTECDSTQVRSVMKRLESIEIKLDGERIPIGYSVGWTQYKFGQKPSELMEEADKVLYADKQGRKARSSALAV
jgi:diguanylate cyclase (GGDEF)-like protein